MIHTNESGLKICRLVIIYPGDFILVDGDLTIGESGGGGGGNPKKKICQIHLYKELRCHKT